MSSADNLNAAISAADAEVSRLKQRQALPGFPKRSKPFLVAFLLVVLGGLLFFSQHVLLDLFMDKTGSEIRAAVIDLLIEADGEVIRSYQGAGELPEQLSSPALGALVNYVRIDAKNYVLSPVYPVYKVELKRNVEVMLRPDEVASLVAEK